jgi:sugar O-acyltransferase (sialic acid O-acetyltransferase NeuD family)
MAKVVMFGAGKGADTAYRYMSRDSPHEICAFTIDAAYITSTTLHGLPVVAYEDVASRFPPGDYEMFVALGFQQMNALRAAKYLDVKSRGYRCVSYVHSRRSWVDPAAVGENCFILDSQIFNFDVTIGNNVTMWSGNHVGDRTRVGDHVWISSHVTLSGDVTVGDACFLGVNSCVSNHVRLGARTFVGANALISKDTDDGSVFVAPAAKPVAMQSDRFLAMLNVT